MPLTPAFRPCVTLTTTFPVLAPTARPAAISNLSSTASGSLVLLYNFIRAPPSRTSDRLLVVPAVALSARVLQSSDCAEHHSFVWCPSPSRIPGWLSRLRREDCWPGLESTCQLLGLAAYL